LTEPLGFLLGYPPLEAFGFASMSSPLPRVFTDRAGMEDFALAYRLSIRTKSGQREERDLHASDFSRLEGPFARRAAYSAAIGYAPRLPDSLWQNALHYGFCETATLGDALELREPPALVKLTLTSKTRGRPKHWTVSVRCAR
jgi:hypothetical protein